MSLDELNPAQHRAVLYVSAALPDLDREVLIDMLIAVDWDAEAVIDTMGGRENIPKKFGDESDWPSLGNTQPQRPATANSRRYPESKQRTFSGDLSSTKTNDISCGFPLSHSRSTPISTGTSESKIRHNSVPNTTHDECNRNTPAHRENQNSNSNVPFSSVKEKFPVGLPDLFEPIDGEDWQELNLDEDFIRSLSKLYPTHPGDEIKGNTKIRIPPTLAFELYKLVLLNVAYRQNVESTDVAQDSSELDSPSHVSSVSGWKICGNSSTASGRLRDTTHSQIFNFPPESGSQPSRMAQGDTQNVQQQRSKQGSSESNDQVVAGSVDSDKDLTYHEYRDLAYQHHLRVNEIKEKINGIQKQQGSGGIADYYRDELRKHQRLMRAANDKAKELILGESDMNKSDTILDLHNLFLNEAMATLQRFLQSWRQKINITGGKAILKIITGRGNNSFGNMARIRPAVINSLSSQHISHVVLDGMVIVTLNGPRDRKR